MLHYPITTHTVPACSTWTPLSHKRILEHFRISRSWERIEEYCTQQEGELLPNELPILTWLDWVYRDSPQTIRLYARYAAGFLNHARIDFNRVGEYDIKAYMNHMAITGMKPSSRNTVLASLKSFYGFLTARQITYSNPALLIKKAKAHQNTKKNRTLGQEDLQTLWMYMQEYAPTRELAMLKTLYYCGLRREEIATLTWGDLHRWQDAWHLRVIGKGSKERKVFVPTMALQAIWRYREDQFRLRPEEPAAQLNDWPLFASKRRVTTHISTDTVYSSVRRYVKLALGISASPHWFRHTFCTHLAMLGEPVERIKVAAGHESVETTMTYIDIANERRAAGMAFEKSPSTPE